MKKCFRFLSLIFIVFCLPLNSYASSDRAGVQSFPQNNLIIKLEQFVDDRDYDAAIIFANSIINNLQGNLDFRAKILKIKSAAYFYKGMFREKLGVDAEIYDIHNVLYGFKSDATVDSAYNLAASYARAQELEKAINLFKRVYGYRVDELGKDNPKSILSLISIGSAYYDLQNYAQAEIYMSEAVSINENIEYEDELGGLLALSYMNLSRLYITLNNFDKGLDYSFKGINANIKFLGPEHPNTAVSLSQIAKLSYFVDDPKKSLLYQEEALTILLEYLDIDHPSIQQLTLNIADTYIKIRDYDRAENYADLVFDNLKTSKGATSDIIIEAHTILAQIYLFSGREELAYDAIGKAFLYSFNSPTGYNNFLDEMYFILGRFFDIKGQNTQAIFHYKMAINILQGLRSNIAKISNEDLSSYTESVSVSYQLLSDVLIREGRLAEAQQVLDMLKEDELFDFVRRSADADPRRTKVGYTADETRWSNRYESVADRLALLGSEQRDLQQKAKRGLTAGETARLAELKEDLSVAEKAFTKFLSEMRSNLKAQGPTKVDEVAATSLASQRELQSIIRDLGPDVVLLQYYVTSSKVGVILTTPNVAIPFNTEIDAKVLNRQVFHLKNALRDPKLSALGPSQSLYQLLLAPVAKALEQTGAKTVMLSLDGQLRHIPFGALHDGTQFAAQRWNFPIYTSVTRDRLRESRTPKWKAAGLGVTKSIGSMKALPAVKLEIDSLLRAVGAQSGQSVVYLDEKFTANRLKEVGQQDFQLIHISSHFTISPGTEVNSFLLLGDGQRLTLGEIRTQNFRFDNVDLLTLSACDTGVGGGRDNTGKEIEGLGVIAQQQGAKSVLATLWPVSDGSTAKLMSDMYQRRQSQRLSKIEALRQAQLAMISQPKYTHPFYWAPFILLGNWQ